MRKEPFWLFLFVTCLSAVFSSNARATDHKVVAQQDEKEVARLVRDLCRRDVVLLGEDGNHGSGRTLELKTELVRRLHEKCGFDAVFFESQIYDLIDFERSLVKGKATQAGLTDAIGAVWSRWKESEPLLSYLFAEAKAGRLQVAGLDPQVGGIGSRFVPNGLGDELTAFLDAGQRDACAATLQRHNGWKYDETHPFDDAAKASLRACSLRYPCGHSPACTDGGDG